MLHLKQDHSELVVLSVLAEGPSYGYAISKEIAARSDGHFKLSPSGMYPLLTKLEKQGLVTTTWEEIKSRSSNPDASGRKRKWYTMSVKGSKRLTQHIENQQRVLKILNGFVPASLRESGLELA
ncbi:MAG: PadR family transcriptional regulator [Phycisphaerales bacterium]|nr:PadR family transcriptional regulator [Phycisphaerales bacterium]